MQFLWWEKVEDDRKEAVYDTVRIVLLIGLAIRGGLLLTGLSLLVVEGNFLLDWAITLGLPQRFGVEDVEEVTVIALIVVGIFLVLGIVWRYSVIRRMSDLQSRVGRSRGGAVRSLNRAMRASQRRVEVEAWLASPFGSVFREVDFFFLAYRNGFLEIRKRDWPILHSFFQKALSYTGKKKDPVFSTRTEP